MSTREILANVARAEALKCFHGFVMGTTSNIAPLIAPFPTWTIEEADHNWCATFVYYCC